MTTKDVLTQFREAFPNKLETLVYTDDESHFEDSSKDVEDFLSTSISKLLDEVVEAMTKLRKDDAKYSDIYYEDRESREERLSERSWNQGLSTAIEIINSKR